MKENLYIEQNYKKSQRKTSIELLRIISMIMITFHHFACHGNFNWGGGSQLTVQHFWYNFINMGGKIGVNIFVLISGYFLINSKGITIKKIFKFLGQILFYSVSILLLFSLFSNENLEIKYFIKTLFPIIFKSYWFASTYFVLFLFHPFLNKFLHNIDKKTYQKLILLLIFCWSIIPTFLNQNYESNSLLWFMTLYTIASYIRLYGLNNKFKLKHYTFFFIGSLTLTYLSSVILLILGTKIPSFNNHIYAFYGQQDLNIFFVALSLFMIFSNLKLNYNSFINTLASSAFGVYLIHENYLVRPFLWINIFKNYQYQNSILLIPYSILVVSIVYLICSLIDLLRQKIIEKPYMQIVDKYSNKLLNALRKIYQTCTKYIFN